MYNFSIQLGTNYHNTFTSESIPPSAPLHLKTPVHPAKTLNPSTTPCKADWEYHALTQIDFETSTNQTEAHVRILTKQELLLIEAKIKLCGSKNHQITPTENEYYFRMIEWFLWSNIWFHYNFFEAR